MESVSVGSNLLFLFSFLHFMDRPLTCILLSLFPVLNTVDEWMLFDQRLDGALGIYIYWHCYTHAANLERKNSPHLEVKHSNQFMHLCVRCNLNGYEWMNVPVAFVIYRLNFSTQKTTPTYARGKNIVRLNFAQLHLFFFNSGSLTLRCIKNVRWSRF